MMHKYLIIAGREKLRAYTGCETRRELQQPVPGLINMFPWGARWMYERLGELRPGRPMPFNPRTNYNLYGFIKYGSCLAISILSAWWLSGYHLLLTPLSLLVFYLCEIHFLFLFPLLIDNTPRPILTGIRSVYRIGIVKCLVTVIPIAIFMLAGLLRRKNNFRNWYIGCFAVLIWYNNEVTTRI